MRNTTSTGGHTPEELETLLEDGLLARDITAVSELFLPHGTLAIGLGGRVEAGPASPERLSALADARSQCFVADPQLVLHSRRTALVLGMDSLSVARRDRHSRWHYAICLLGNTTGEDR